MMFDYIVVGSGAGGATIAKELAVAGKSVLIIEGGEHVSSEQACRAYKIIPSGVEIWQIFGVGGTTLVSMGNAVRSLNKGLHEYYSEAERELGVSLVPESHMGNGTRLLLNAFNGWEAMPKFIDFSRCKSCGKCPLGCPHRAKWDAVSYLKQAISNGASLLTGAPVNKVLIERGRAIGVETVDGKTFRGKTTILSAGAIDTPRILMRSGIEGAGHGLYVDAYVTVGGIVEDVGLNSELNMEIFIKREGYLLSPHYSTFLLPQLSSKGISARPTDVLGIMVKIADEPTGVIEMKHVIKGLTSKDLSLLESGKEAAKEILIRAGAKPETIVSTYPRGAHPGGSCTSIVKDFEPVIESLYISDASILPGPLGVPPLLAIIATSKKIAAMLTGRA
ncbi:MAG: GMC family oxidoreductase N-terminal domain-containing protein [Candidatus Methanomethylicaceae archaeon]